MSSNLSDRRNVSPNINSFIEVNGKVIGDLEVVDEEDNNSVYVKG